MDQQAVSDWRNEVQRRRGILLDYLLLAATIIGLIAVILTYLGGLDEKGANPLERIDLIPFLVGWFFVLIVWRWRGLGYRVRAGSLVLFAYLMSCYLLWLSELIGSGRIWLVLLPALTFVLLGARPGFAVGGLSIVTYAVFALVLSQRDPATSGYWVTEAGDFLIGVVGIAMILWSFNRGWVDALGQAGAANVQLRAQTKELEETARQLRATAAVAHACSFILDPEALVGEVVNQIQKEFGGMGVYYVGLFLFGETEGDGRFAVLKAATGSIGRQLLEQGHALTLDGTSAVGQCINQQRPVVAPGEDRGARLAGPPLEATRSEVALPLRSRGRVLGALSVQSTRKDAFAEGMVAVLGAMADQVAVALDNARLFAQTGAALREVQVAQRRYLTKAWKAFLEVRPVTHVDYVQPGAEPGDGRLLRDAQRAAMVHERSVATDLSPDPEDPTLPQAVLAVPLKLRGQVIGTLTLHETRRRRPWTSEEIALAETIAEQVALTVENLRLMDEAQRRATHEQLIGGVTARLRETLDMDTILQTAAREIREELGLRDVTIQLEMDVDRTAQ